jgi:hypothetical protein
MMKSSRDNRLQASWRCPHCGMGIDASTFRLSRYECSQIHCPRQACGRTFAWTRQNRGRLWPEQRAYTVLR